MAVANTLSTDERYGRDCGSGARCNGQRRGRTGMIGNRRKWMADIVEIDEHT